MKKVISSLALIAIMLLSSTAPVKASDDDAALMKACPDLTAWAATHPHGADVVAERDTNRRFAQPAVRNELAKRAAADSKARESTITSGGTGIDTPAIRALLAVDADNLAWLKRIVAEQGFPTLMEVGAQGMSNAWLLVQHADRDTNFQSSVLDTLLRRPAGEGVQKRDLAMLQDRVLRAQGKLQRYATQFKAGERGSLVPEPTEDMAHVDQRRAAMGLMPLAIYRCVLQATFGAQ